MSQVREDPATPALKLRSLGGPYLILPKRSNRGKEGQSAGENISHSALHIQRGSSQDAGKTTVWEFTAEGIRDWQREWTRRLLNRDLGARFRFLGEVLYAVVDYFPDR